MPDQRGDQLTFLTETANESIFIACINFLFAEAETSYKLVCFLALQSSRSVENVIRCVVDDIHLVVFVLEEFALQRPLNINSFRKFLFFEVPL